MSHYYIQRASMWYFIKDKVFHHTSLEECMLHHTHTDKCPQLNSINSHLTLRKPNFLSLSISFLLGMAMGQYGSGFAPPRPDPLR